MEHADVSLLGCTVCEWCVSLVVSVVDLDTSIVPDVFGLHACWISCRFVVYLGAHTSSSLVVRYVCVGCFVVVSDRSVRFACVPVSDDSVLYCGLYHG